MSHPTELRRGGLWAGWQITGHSCCHGDCRSCRRWITHQRSSVNHQSPLTSHYRHRHPHPPPLFFSQTHILTHAHIRRGCSTKSHGTSSADESTQTLQERRPLLYLAPLCLSAFLFPPAPLSSLTPTYHFTCHFTTSLLSCHLLLSPLPSSALFSISLHPRVLQVAQFISTPLCFVPQWHISLLCLAGHLAAQHHRASKSLLTF